MSYKSSLVELPLFGTHWVFEHVYNLGNHLVIQSTIVKNVTYIYLSWLACTEFRLVPYYPACDLRTLGLTYITPQSSLHAVPFTRTFNALFRDGNNPGKPFSEGKESIFTACHSGKLKLAFTSPNVISTSPPNFLMSRIDFTVLL